MAAPRTLIDVPAERRRTAAQDGVENFLMYPGEPTPAAIEERVSCCVCQLDLAPFDALIWPHLVFA